MNDCDPNRTVIQHDNEFTMVNTMSFDSGKNQYVFPIQCEQVFYSQVPGRVGWSFVVRYDLRGRLVKYNVVEEDDIEEEDDPQEHDVAYVLGEEPEEVEPNVLGENAILDDDVDEDMLENDIDDVVDMVNPFNTFEPNDIDVEFDEE